MGCPALPCSEGTFPPQGAAVGSRSSALVDEHETIFKKNPRRVVRPAGESCVGTGGVWVPTWQRIGGRFSLGSGRFSVRMGEAGAAPCLREQQGSASPAPCRCLLPHHFSCRLHQVGDRSAPRRLRGGRRLFGGQEQVSPWPQHRAGETLGVPRSWLPSGGAGCRASRALLLPTQAACLAPCRRRRRRTSITWWRSIARGWPAAACAAAPPW